MEKGYHFIDIFNFHVHYILIEEFIINSMNNKQEKIATSNLFAIQIIRYTLLYYYFHSGQFSVCFLLLEAFILNRLVRSLLIFIPGTVIIHKKVDFRIFFVSPFESMT